MGLTEAVRSLETPTETEPNGDDGSGDGDGDDGGGGVIDSGGKDAVSSTVETLPDVPGGVPLLNCKVWIAPVIP